MSYTHRYLAHLIIEAETPLAVGSGEEGINTDRLVAKDANGLPYIPGTSLTGVLRHSLGNENEKWIENIFGSGGDKGTGSRLLLSSAFLIGADGETVMDGLRNINFRKEPYAFFSRLPERDHVRINAKGAADTENHGKFDEELVHKGTRFAFELEFMATDSEQGKAYWDEILAALNAPTYRIGAGTRKGFGNMKIVKELSKTICWTLTEEKDLKAYLQKSGSLNDSIENWEAFDLSTDSNKLTGWKNYSFQLNPKDFFVFSAGFGDEEADNKPKKESFFEWSSGKPVLTERGFTLIPATSVKGALAHRVAYHYNLLKGNIIGKGVEGLETRVNEEEFIQRIKNDLDIDNKTYDAESEEWGKLKRKIENLTLENNENWEDFNLKLNDEVDQKEGVNTPVLENNKAVQELFGFAKDSENKKDGLRGRVLIEDVYLDEVKEKVFNHTSIDRFTNGTIDGALFQEKVSYTRNPITLKIWVEEKAWQQDEVIQQAFENTIADLKAGRLALGGNTTKGHGMFQEFKN